ncbi:MAG: hypothetical protein LAT64_09010 [Phycisphaerales bacterium]|nr:hypothetical protein [Planctomycetota bacterium]MCH8508889.1 hypothetical protein [Phycisphaerales bacterium]
MRRTATALLIVACGLLCAANAFAGSPRSSLPSSSPVPEGEQPYEYRLEGMSDNLRFSESVPSPRQFLGYDIGTHFTRTHDTVAYVRALAGASDRAVYLPYGRTHQRRELGILTVSSPQNLASLDRILERNRELARPGEVGEARVREIARTNPAVVWLSFNVHGNEASCTEAALQLAYTLTAATNPEIERMLERVVVVIDPCLNPDGRARYVHWFEQVVGATPDPTPIAREHREPWPSGRPNHYLFDLNRDWLWGVQPESRARMAMYRRYMPQVHIDYHEQGMHRPYFLGAGDTPYSTNIPEESKDWFDRLGRASAVAMDRAGLPYATRERFDYLYPGYGKVTPVYHGAISLLTEQAGHGRAGLTIDVDAPNTPGYNLSLQDRTRNHFITAMSYVEHSAQNRQAQLERFARYFRQSAEGSSDTIAGFVISAGNDPALLDRVWDVCNIHGIEIHRLTRDTELDASGVRNYFPPFEAEGETATLAEGSWYIPTAQPMGLLALTVFERETYVEDRDTYDITSWSYPALLGLDAVEIGTPIEPSHLERVERFEAFPARSATERPRVEDSYAFFVPSDDHRFPIALGLASQKNLFARLTSETIELTTGETIPAGSLLVMPSRNRQETIAAFADRLWEQRFVLHATHAGIPARGPAIGNNANRRFMPARVVLASGSPISSLSFGHTWHMLDHAYPTPHTVVNLDDLGSVDWNTVNVLVLPSGNLGRAITGSTLDRLKAWLREGGTVVALANSARWASSELVGLSSSENVDDDGDAKPLPWDTTDRTPARELHTLTHAQREARSVDRRVPGALIAASIDTTHPLAAGLGERVAFHVFSGAPLPVASGGFVLARFGSFHRTDNLESQTFAPRIGGSISPGNLQRLADQPAVTHHRVGRGNVICLLSDPTNRGMNHAGMRVLLNAIHLGPSMSGAQPLGEEDDEHEG